MVRMVRVYACRAWEMVLVLGEYRVYDDFQEYARA